MLSIKSVNQYYGQQHTLWDVDLELSRGQCTALIGRAGVGKTTLINCIMGHLPVKSGQIFWQSGNHPPLNLLTQPTENRALMGIGYVPQGRQIFSQLSVNENLQVAMLAGRYKNRPIPDKIYDLFPQLKQLGAYKAGELSDTQQQQLAISRALVQDPELLILDEPAEDNNPQMTSSMSSLLRRLNRELGLTILLVGHKLPFIRNVADRFWLMHHGRNVAQGALDQLDEQLINTYLTV
jgi:urea transport system ATP-binding protein